MGKNQGRPGSKDQGQGQAQEHLEEAPLVLANDASAILLSHF